MSESNASAPTSRYRPETRLVQSGVIRSEFGETSEALFLTQGYVYDSAEQCEARFKGEDPGYIYSRYSNPTIAMFERRMIELEGAEAARSTATGMAAVTTAILAPLKAGDHVVASKALFGSCLYVVQDLLPRYGIESTLVDGLDLDQWRKAMRPSTKSFFLESPTNPTLDVVDIGAIAEIAHQGGARLIVDNVFATPIWQSPLSLGADVVVYSATKHIDGQGRCLGGVILSSEAFITELFHQVITGEQRHVAETACPCAHAAGFGTVVDVWQHQVDLDARMDEPFAAELDNFIGFEIFLGMCRRSHARSMQRRHVRGHAIRAGREDRSVDGAVAAEDAVTVHQPDRALVVVRQHADVTPAKITAENTHRRQQHGQQRHTERECCSVDHKKK